MKTPIDRKRAQELVHEAWKAGWWRIPYAEGERAWLLEYWETLPDSYSEADALRSLAHEPGNAPFDYTYVVLH